MLYFNFRQLVFSGVVLLKSCLLISMASAGGLEVDLWDQNSNRIEDAVILLYPIEGQSMSDAAPYPAIMTQRGMAFVPHVLPVYVGSSVNFPNEDETRHHVYSFSAAKVFELRLYDGDTERSVDFESPGAIILGCNIHDSMLGYIYVTDTPLFIKSDAEGQAHFIDLTEGLYHMRTWHPRMRGEITQTERSITIKKDGTLTISQELRLRPARRYTGRY